jgi:hypothetical protein
MRACPTCTHTCGLAAKLHRLLLCPSPPAHPACCCLYQHHRPSCCSSCQHNQRSRPFLQLRLLLHALLRPVLQAFWAWALVL